ncbi:MAG: hypothetical protein EXS63_01380 [Candidatus Omnitrophica bacterium]|nr:hypothetical protein [Candidatus Omnitrophota bacterium]
MLGRLFPDKLLNKKTFLLTGGIIFILMQGISIAKEAGPVFRNYYSKDPRASSTVISSEDAQDQIQSPKKEIIPAQSLAPGSTLQKADADREIKTTSGISFRDLHFDPKLSDKGEIKISGHESLLFQKDSIVAHSYGNQVSLNLEDQKMLCVTYIGYVLGPFTPSQDYLDGYIDTLESIKTLMNKAASLERTKEIKDETYLAGLSQAKTTLTEFAARTKKVREAIESEELNEHLRGAIERHYENDLPDYADLNFEEKKENKNSSHWEAVMTFNQAREAGKIQNRLFILKTIREDFAVVETQDRDAQNHVLVREIFDYDSAFKLKEHRIKNFYLSGKVKTDHDLRYEDGIKSARYYRVFDEQGKRARFLNETFYVDGNTKTSSDYQYLSKKKFFYKFNSDGRVTHSSTEPLALNPS